MINIKFTKPLILIAIFINSISHLSAQRNIYQFLDSSVYKVREVYPSETNNTSTCWDTVHVIYYNPEITNNKLLLWLTGTTGTTRNIPKDFFITALEQGYRIIALSFISVPAVVEVCRGDNLKQNTDCAAEFRRRRIYGDNIFPMIPDQPQDAIVPRFVSLLQYLSRTDPEGNWQQYLENGMDKPRWTKIAVSGQSQGGGMAQFIAKYENTARIISFSGGWDYSDSVNEKIADWYYRENITPPDKCYAAYNVNELAADSMREINEALKIPECNSFALDKPIQDATLLKNHRNPYHGDGLRNPLYKVVWIKMLGSGL